MESLWQAREILPADHAAPVDFELEVGGIPARHACLRPSGDHAVGETDTLAEARNWLATHACDLVFLDIQLWGGTGFDLVPLILSEARIIFVTAFDNYAVRAFEVNALDYLIKPVRRWHPRVSHPTIWFISRPAKARRGLSPCPPSPRSKPAKIIPQCSSVTARGSWCDAR